MSHVCYPGSKSPNGWEINEIIDSGGWGTMYIVEHPQHEESLAVETFKQQFFSNSLFTQRFLNEAETWIQLGKHNHIARAKFVETIEGKPYVFLEYISSPAPNLRHLFHHFCLSLFLSLDGHKIKIEKETNWSKSGEGSLIFPWDREPGDPQARFFKDGVEWHLEGFQAKHGRHRSNRQGHKRIERSVKLEQEDLVKASETWLVVRQDE